MKVKILTDTSCGLSRKEAESLGYEMIALPFMLDEKEYDDDVITKDEFYAKLRESSEIHTSQAPMEIVMKKFDELLSTYDHIIYLPITSGLSSTYQNGVALSSDDKYKGKITCIDHRTISVLQRTMLSDVKRLIDKDVKPDRIKELVEANAKNNRIYIAVDNLDYLKKGGRVSPLVATIGNILNIKPILFSDGGKFDAVKKVRSVKAAEDGIKELLLKDLHEVLGLDDFSKVSVGASYTECTDEINKFKADIEQSFGVKVVCDELPSVVGCHIGPGAVAAALYKIVDEC